MVPEEEFVPTKEEKKTNPYMTPYEYTALIDARACQIGVGEKPKIETDDYNPLRIATEEVNKQLVSLVVRRHLPDATTEDWKVKDLILPSTLVN